MGFWGNLWEGVKTVFGKGSNFVMNGSTYINESDARQEYDFDKNLDQSQRLFDFETKKKQTGWNFTKQMDQYGFTKDLVVYGGLGVGSILLITIILNS